MLDNKIDFLAKYQVLEKDYRKSKLKWEDLKAIYSDFVSKVPHLNSIGLSISNALQVQTGVHSVRYRVKDPEHLIEKIIRKVSENPKRKIDISNYELEITDLIGVRAIHLFKSNWQSIDYFIRQTWEFKENPIAYYRKGDPEDITSTFNSSQFDLKIHEAGYRSLHYVLITKPTKKEHFVELQVRTLFEEGWSEIDHKIRYPHNTSNDLINSLLMIFNRLAGSADEIGEYVKMLSIALKAREEEFHVTLDAREQEIVSLKNQIDGLKLKPQQKVKLFETIDQISKFQNSYIDVSKEIDFTKFYKEATGWDTIVNIQSHIGGLGEKLSTFTKAIDGSKWGADLSDYSIKTPVDLNKIKPTNPDKTED